MAASYPSQASVFIPSHEASGALVTDFSRNVNDFALPKYAQYIPTKDKKTAGYYMRMTIEQAGRLLNSDLSDLVWPDGGDAPGFNNETESHDFVAFLCKRYAFGFKLGDLTVQNAAWDILAKHARMTAQRAMTARTLLTLTAATTAGNWGTHTGTVASLTGGTNWSSATSSNLNIKVSLDRALALIIKDTLGAINMDDLRLVISPGCAAKLVETQEIVDLIKQSPNAIQYIRNELAGGSTMFGLPDKLYGIPLVVEKTVRVTSRKGATTARSYVLADDKALLVSRPGGLVGTDEAPTFSTLGIFFAEEMTVEQKNDVDNRRTIGRVVENYAPAVISPVSGYLFTSATS